MIYFLIIIGGYQVNEGKNISIYLLFSRKFSWNLSIHTTTYSPKYVFLSHSFPNISEISNPIIP